MPTSGLVLTVKPEQDALAQVKEWLELDARFEAGDTPKDQPNKLPISLQTDTMAEDKACWESLNNHPQIMHVDVVFVSFEDEPTEIETTNLSPTPSA